VSSEAHDAVVLLDHAGELSMEPFAAMWSGSEALVGSEAPVVLRSRTFIALTSSSID